MCFVVQCSVFLSLNIVPFLFGSILVSSIHETFFQWPSGSGLMESKLFRDGFQLKALFNNILWMDMNKVQLFGLNEKCSTFIIPIVKHGGGSIMVWACFAASASGRLATIYVMIEF
uniref:Uncharacterized protein n=1 Tax=Astyanax mexicanus TaxID=7994 RepID=A0A3B1JDL2_ASTMX